MKLESLSQRTPASLAFSIRKHTHGSILELLKKREGLVLRWYLDSLGKKTGGYGHLWVKGDPLSIDQKWASDTLEKDSQKATTAATIQFESLPIQTQDLYDVLVSVNFQLGTRWYLKFPKTWKLMTQGAYPEAAIEAQDSDWYKQTPVRVKDLQKALNEAALLGKQYADLGL